MKSEPITQTSMLSGAQIRDGWLKHIMTEEENYLWVSNQRALDLMQEGVRSGSLKIEDKELVWISSLRDEVASIPVNARVYKVASCMLSLP